MPTALKKKKKNGFLIPWIPDHSFNLKIIIDMLVWNQSSGFVSKLKKKIFENICNIFHKCSFMSKLGKAFKYIYNIYFMIYFATTLPSVLASLLSRGKSEQLKDDSKRLSFSYILKLAWCPLIRRQTQCKWVE